MIISKSEPKPDDIKNIYIMIMMIKIWFKYTMNNEVFK